MNIQFLVPQLVVCSCVAKKAARLITQAPYFGYVTLALTKILTLQIVLSWVNINTKVEKYPDKQSLHQ